MPITTHVVPVHLAAESWRWRRRNRQEAGRRGVCAWATRRRARFLDSLISTTSSSFRSRKTKQVTFQSTSHSLVVYRFNSYLKDISVFLGELYFLATSYPGAMSPHGTVFKFMDPSRCSITHSIKSCAFNHRNTCCQQGKVGVGYVGTRKQQFKWTSKFRDDIL